MSQISKLPFVARRSVDRPNVRLKILLALLLMRGA